MFGIWLTAYTIWHANVPLSFSQFLLLTLAWLLDTIVIPETNDAYLLLSKDTTIAGCI